MIRDDRPTTESEIEITPEMIEAAGEVFIAKMGDTWPEWRGPPSWLAEVLQAAFRCRA